MVEFPGCNGPEDPEEKRCARMSTRSRNSRRAADEADGALGAGQEAHVVPMRRQTIAVQVCAFLRREIISGVLLPRAPLSEQELSQRFGVSRTPIREALIKLSQENLVEIYPQYGSFVAPIKLQDVFDSQFVREALECAAIERAVERIDAAQAKALNAVLRRQRLMQRADDEAAFFIADEQMHAMIMEIAGHPNAWRQVESAKAQMDRVRHLTMRLPRKLSSVVAEHEAIVDRLIDHDRAGALEAMRVHVRGLFRSVEILKREHANYFAEDDGASSVLRSIAVPAAPAVVKVAADAQRHLVVGHEDH
jgi:GntR family transcriptional regulator, rspAB operon transcriptional repressor